MVGALKVGVVSRTDMLEAVSTAKAVVEHLISRGIEVLVETDTALAINMAKMNTDLSEMDADFIVTIGGDGTILRTAMLMKKPETPLLGVNKGRRGFLTESSPDNLRRDLDRVLKGDYRLEECIKLSSRSLEIMGAFPDSLNEVLIASSLPSKVLEVCLSIDDENIVEIQVDGVIVATPTGSTAYNLSAGGSILKPDVEAMIMTTICPYSYFRSIVVPLSSRVEIELLKPDADALAIVDGCVHTAIKPLSTIEVCESPHKARFIRFGSFFSRLERRLSFRQFK